MDTEHIYNFQNNFFIIHTRIVMCEVLNNMKFFLCCYIFFKLEKNLNLNIFIHSVTNAEEKLNDFYDRLELFLNIS